MKTTTLITSALIGRVPERSTSLGFASAHAPASSPFAPSHVAAVPTVDVCTCVATASTATASDVTTASHAFVSAPHAATTAHAAMANLWLGGFQGKGFGSGAYGTKRIQPGRLEGMT